MLSSLVTPLLVLACVGAVSITINNLEPRLDNNGNIMDSHDFSLHLYPDGYYYMTSVAYGPCLCVHCSLPASPLAGC